MTSQEIIDVVEKLNAEIDEQNNDADYAELTYVTNGYVHRVESLGCTLWDSEHDEREVTEGGELEPLEGYLRDMFDMNIDILQEVKLSN